MKELRQKDLGSGVSRSVLTYNKDVMMTEIHFEKDSKIASRPHPHVQCSRGMSGRFCFEAGDKPLEVGEGDTIVFPSGIEHCVTCLESGRVMEIFPPMREDFI